MSFLASFVPNEIYFQVRAFHHIYSITSGLALDCGVQMRQLQAGCPKPLPIGVSKNCPFTQSDFACDSLTMRCAALRSSQRFCVCASASPLGFQCHNSTSYCQLPLSFLSSLSSLSSFMPVACRQFLAVWPSSSTAQAWERNGLPSELEGSRCKSESAEAKRQGKHSLTVLTMFNLETQKVLNFEMN